MFLGYALELVYAVFLLMYLTHAQKTDMYMSTQDQTFRKAALVITWIWTVLIGFGLVYCIGGMMGFKMPNYLPSY